jgi:tricorn protease
MREVAVQVVTDRATLKPRVQKIVSRIVDASVSPSGKRAAFEARGEVLTVPARDGAIVNLTRSSGVAERYPRWSPDGKSIAYWSDRSGEYELTIRPADGAGPERTLTSLGRGFRYTPFWSPDSTMIAFVDEAARIRMVEVSSGRTRDLDKSPVWLSDGPLQQFQFRWSADSRWVAWARPADDNENPAIFVYDTKTSARRQLTTGYFQDAEPTFDPAGKYLFFLSNRAFEPIYSDFDDTWT